ncbi:hypothetical protein HK104_006624 [Borealophlyctis nickersoniae]|nr:hypothetical protein HK104_006624 [Borealophlyctis nickersoniae]
MSRKRSRSPSPVPTESAVLSPHSPVQHESFPDAPKDKKLRATESQDQLQQLPPVRRNTVATRLPFEVVGEICTYLQNKEVCSLALVCKGWMAGGSDFLNESIDICTKAQLGKLASSLREYEKLKREGQNLPIDRDPALVIRSLILQPQLPPALEKKDKPEIRNEFKRDSRYILSRATNLKRLTIFGRPELVKFCFRDIISSDAESEGVKKMLRNLEHLGLAACQTAGTDFRLDWLFKNVWTKLQRYPDGSWAEPPGDAAFVRKVLIAHRPQKKGDNKKGKPRPPITYPGEQVGEKYYTRLRSLNLRDVFKFNHFILNHIGSHLKHLEELNLSASHFNRKKHFHLKPNVGAECMGKMIEQMTNLKILKLSPRFSIKLPFLNQIFQIKTLRELHLSNLDIVKIEGSVEDQREDLKVQVDLPKLEVFRLEKSPYRTAVIQKIAKGSPNLRVAALSKCGDIPPADIAVLSHCKNLRTLEIIHSGAYRGQLDALSQVITDLPSLTRLTLLSHPNRKIPTMTHPRVLEAIKWHPNLHHVNLTFNNDRFTVENYEFELFDWDVYKDLASRPILKERGQKSVINFYSCPSRKAKTRLHKVFKTGGWLVGHPWPKCAKPYKPEKQVEKGETHHREFLEAARPRDAQRAQERAAEEARLKAEKKAREREELEREIEEMERQAREKRARGGYYGDLVLMEMDGEPTYAALHQQGGPSRVHEHMNSREMRETGGRTRCFRPCRPSSTRGAV